jgi:dTDP-4-dehydrorhamnose reductase
MYMPSIKSVLITGGTGLLALNWAWALRDSWHVILGTHRHSVKLQGVSSQQLYLNSEEKFGYQLDALKPDLVVHTAGMTNVDQCELHPDLAYEANVAIAHNVARATAVRNIKLIHISTDHLFSGDDIFYHEESKPQPLNEYGKTKLLAEDRILAEHTHPLIIRTNFFCWGHAKRQSFTDWLLYNMWEGKKLTLFDNVYFTPILADKLILATHDLLEKGAAGIFNLAGNERLSKYQFAIEVCHAFNLPSMLIQRGKMINAQGSTRRPYDMSLNTDKAREMLGYSLGNVKEYLSALYSQHLMGRRQTLFETIS